QIFCLLIFFYTGFLLLGGREIGGDFWGAVSSGWGLIVLQSLVGVVLGLSGQAPVRGVHYLYGLIALITWPATFAFTQGKTGRREVFIWMFTTAFLFGVFLRTVFTALNDVPF
ncbi:MAG: hypothetical protein ACFB51_12760, partial [Anaerolineae bacterium]